MYTTSQDWFVSVILWASKLSTKIKPTVPRMGLHKITKCVFYAHRRY